MSNIFFDFHTIFFIKVNLFLISEIVLDKQKIVIYLHPISGCSVARLSRPASWEDRKECSYYFRLKTIILQYIRGVA